MRKRIEYARSEDIFEGKKVIILAVGSMVETAVKVRELLMEKGIEPAVVNARFIKPIDEEMVKAAVSGYSLIVTMEENVLSGAFGEKVRTMADELKFTGDIINIGIPDEYVEHGNVEILKKDIGIDAESVARRIIEHEKKT